MFTRAYIFTIILLGFCNTYKAQKNLVPNWSFEEYNACPIIGNQDCISTFPLIPSLKDWYCAITIRSTPDYYNNCSIGNYGFLGYGGYQKSHSGNAHVGGSMWSLTGSVATYNIEYIECTLKDSLKSKSYCVQFYVNNADQASYSISQYGALLTKNKIIYDGSTNPIFINFTPQVKNPLGNFIIDSINWTKIEGSFMASGGEKYLTLGCFGPQSLTDTLLLKFNSLDSYIYLDDVSVEEVLDADAGLNKTIHCGDSIRIGLDSAWAANYSWQPSVGLSHTNEATPIANPTITTTYTVTKQQCNVTTTSTVTVFVINTCPIISDDEFVIPNVFTPNGDNANDVWRFSLGFGNTLNSLTVYNRWGLSHTPTLSKGEGTGQPRNVVLWDGRTTSGVECSAGVYFYTLQYTNILGEQKIINGYVTLIR